MTQTETVLSAVTDVIGNAPHSAAGLILYALVNTLAYEKSGCLFKLDKLRDLDVENRRLAYQLMEIMALGDNRGRVFNEAKLKMDEIVRNA